MNWFDRLPGKFHNVIGTRSTNEGDYDSIDEPEIESPVNALGALLIGILAFPLQILTLPLKALNLFHSSPVDIDYHEHEPGAVGEKISCWMKSLGSFLLQIPYLLVTAPVRMLRVLNQTGRRELLFIIPALTVAAILGYVFLQVGLNRESINNRYAKGVDRAISNKDYPLALTYFNRYLVDNELTPAQKMQYMLVLSETGEAQRAAEILDELAPPDSPGYGPAHAIQAIKLAVEVGSSQSTNPALLLKLKKHLERSNHAKSPELLQAWAVYYQQVHQPDQAIEKLIAAAKDRPQLYLEIAAYQRQENRDEDANATLRLAAATYREALAQNPLDRQSLLVLALICKSLDQWEAAENLMIDGLRLHPDQQMRTVAADFFTLRQDQIETDGGGIADRLRYLSQALLLDPYHPPIYDRLVKLYNQLESGSPQAAAVRSQVQELVANHPANAVAHFTLSNILWKDGNVEQQKFHLEQAYKLDPKFAVVLNNLAWLLADDEQDPQLERALELIDAALVSEPDNGKLLDTRGTILLKMARYGEAITDLSRSIDSVSNKKLVYSKLAHAYQAMGNQEQAELNRKMSLVNTHPSPN